MTFAIEMHRMVKSRPRKTQPRGPGNKVEKDPVRSSDLPQDYFATQ